VADESKVFSTKERAPYYICLEIYRPEEEEEEKNLQQAIVFEDENKQKRTFWENDVKLSEPITVESINPVTNSKKQIP
jgi:phosphatidylinositol 4-kinase